MMKPGCSAVLLAGGRSTRMGRDKALLPVAGQPLWARQVAVLREAGVGEVLISARPEQTWVPATLPVVRDAVADAGPLAGIAAALARCETSHLIVLAVDLPQMPAAWFRQLWTYCRPGVGAVGWHADFFEPLAAIYPCEIAPHAQAALAAGDSSLQRLLQRAGGRFHVHTITADEASWFANWNEPGAVPPAQE